MCGPVGRSYVAVALARAGAVLMANAIVSAPCAVAGSA